MADAASCRTTGKETRDVNVMAVIDDDGGLMFNHRRLSMDRVLREKILALAGTHVLRMNSYTAGQFEELPDNAVVSEDFLAEAGEEDDCLVEDQPLLPWKDSIRTFYLFHWNRRYPSDVKLDFIPDREGMELSATEDFAGYSHEKITMEVWVR